MCKPLLILFLFCGLFSFRAARSQQVTLNRDQALLQELFLEIHQQTGYFFYYANNDLDEAKPVTIHVSKAPLEEVLGICFAGQPLIYRIDNKTIVVQKKPFVPASLIDLKGKVQTEQGEPLVDVSVELAGTHKVVSTGSGGEFSLDKVNENAVLNFSHVGYEARSVTLNKNQYLTVILKRSVNKLDEVQVIAYGTTTRRFNTGSVSTVAQETIESQPVPNPLLALEGRASGVFITQQTGMPGGAVNIQIRGQNSLRAGGNNPFYVIDGVPYTSTSISSIYTSNSTVGGNPLNEINPSDIERIEILKDADATAIYGSRGSNGVVLITTKKGSPGKMRFILNASTGIARVGHMMPLMNTRQYLDMRHEAFKNDGALPGPYDFDVNGWHTTRYTDWQKALIGGTAGISNFQASISGGSKNTQYLLSGSYNYQGTVFPGDQSDKKGSFHLALNNVSENQKLHFGLTAEFLSDNNQLSNYDMTSIALNAIPDAPSIYDSLGKLNWNGYFDNPYGHLMNEYFSRMDNLISHLQMSYQLVTGLRLHLSGGYNILQSKETATTPVSSFNPSSGLTSAFATFARSSLSSWILEPQLAYDKQWGGFRLNALAGTSFQENKNESQSLGASGYVNDLLLKSLAGASEIDLLDASNIVYRYQAVFARINARWNDKYLINLSGRRDGSSRFGPGRQFANFGSVGAGWIFTKEKFMKDHFPALGFGKLRASYGSAGNDQIGDYGYLSVYSPTNYAYQGVNGLYPGNLFNSKYSWEKNQKMELGIDLGLFQEKILINAAFYRNRCSNLLVGLSLPLITGFSSIQSNLPATVQNRGFELEINSTNIKSSSFLWKTSLNLTFPENKLVAFPGLETSAYANIYSLGKPLSVVKAYQFDGVNPQTGTYQFVSQSHAGDTSSPAYPSDLRSNLALSQRFYGGLLNTLQFREFQLDVFIQFVQQNGRNYHSFLPYLLVVVLSISMLTGSLIILVVLDMLLLLLCPLASATPSYLPCH